MFISNTGNHTVTECCCCKKLMSVKDKKEGYGSIAKIHELYIDHLQKNEKCKTYHDNLPTLSDMKGILSDVDITDGLSPEDFVRKQRNEW